MKPRMVRITIEIVGSTDRDAWEQGDAIARVIKDDFSDFAVECVDVEDPAREPIDG